MAQFVRDPVCGRTINAERSQVYTEYQGKTYHFCCKQCRESFLKKPERYAKEERREPPER